METIQNAKSAIMISGMSCASCAVRIEKGIQTLPGVTAITVNLAAEKATVEYDPSLTDKNKFLKSSKNWATAPLLKRAPLTGKAVTRLMKSAKMSFAGVRSVN